MTDNETENSERYVNKKSRRLRCAVGLLSTLTAIFVFTSLTLPAFSQTGANPSLTSENAEVSSGESVAVEVGASVEAGGNDTVFLLAAKDGGAVLADKYAFSSDVAEVTDEDGNAVELHRVYTDAEAPQYWFGLTAGQSARLKLDFVQASVTGETASINLRGVSAPTLTEAQTALSDDETGSTLSLSWTGTDNQDSTAQAKNAAVITAQSDSQANGVSDFSALQSAVSAGGTQTIKLSADISVNTQNYGLNIPSGTNITLDLNGHKLANTTYTSGAMFNISGGTLTIIDSAAQAETTTTDTSNYGNAANAIVSSGKVSLTYYVTDSQIKDSATGATTETLYKHVVTTGGYIDNSNTNGSIVSISNGGTFNMQGGMLYGGTYSAISQTDGTVNLSGGYICGVDNTYEQNGGAVNMTGGTLNISGSAVLAGNKASLYGGAVYANGSGTTVNVTGGIVSGNSGATDGGGIWTNGTMTLAGGYITNNRSENGYVYGGGGGVFLAGDSARFTMTGGFVTGNWAQTTGGGIGMQEHDSSGSTLSAAISGGFISGNVAYGDEGGGFTVRGYDTCTLTGGYITNNKTQTTRDWGGGGIFISENGILNIKNVLVTDNSSESFGAGVSACSTGKVYLYVQDGAAVYGNNAGSSNPENDAKNEGYEYTHDNTTFLENGYKDIFCVHQSTVMGAMLGGGAANWSGSSASCGVDEPQAANVVSATKAVSAGINDILTADALMGLTASPSDASKTAAQSAAHVYINGNSSTTHGGGIMSNGSLILGNPVDLTVPAKLTLAASKTFKDSSNNDVSLSNNGFSFVVADSDGKTVSTGTCDSNGAITFTPAIGISEGTSTFTVTEVNTGRADVVYDNSVYTMTVTAVKDTGTHNADTDTTIYSTTISSITITEAGKTVSTFTPSAADYTLSAADSRIAFANTSKPTDSGLKTSVTVTKTWSDGNDQHSGSFVTVNLYSGTTETGMSGVLNAANGWKYTFSGLPYYGSDGTTPITYSVKENAVTGYTTTYTTTETTAPSVTFSTSTVTSFSDGGYYLISTGTNGYALAVSCSNGAYSLVTSKYDLTDTAQLWKAVAGNPPEEYTGSPQTGWFYLENVKYPGEWLHFDYSGGISAEKFDVSSTKITTFNINSSDILFTKHKYQNTWYTKDVDIESSGVSLKIETISGTGSRNTYKSATTTEGSTAITVTNTPEGYTLPDTGGSGLLPFIFWSAALILLPTAVFTAEHIGKKAGRRIS